MMLYMSFKKGLSRKIYRYIADDVLAIHNKYLAWIQEVGHNFVDSLIGFGIMHRDVYSITNIAKYRSFQYRLLQRGIVTNVQLCKWGLREDDLCSFCGKSKETLSHIMYYCECVQKMWEELATYLMERFKVNSVNLNVNTILQNQIVSKKKHVGNFICLIAKQFVYRQRCLGNSLHFPILREEICKVE